jgi:hypothetical protein
VSKNKLSMKPALLCLPPAFMLVSCLIYSSNLKMEAIYSSKTLVDFQCTAWCYIPEDSTLYDDLVLSFYNNQQWCFV